MRMRNFYTGMLTGQILSSLFFTGWTLTTLYASLGCVLGVACFQVERTLKPKSVEMAVLPAILAALALLFVGATLDTLLTPALGTPSLSIVFRMFQGFGMALAGYALNRHFLLKNTGTALVPSK